MFSTESIDEDLLNIARHFIQPCLKECREGAGYHARCNEIDPLAEIPTRLVDLGESPSSAVRLVTTNEIQHLHAPIDYVILSYCWGADNESAKTTRSNIKSRREKINMSDLPATIHHAIAIARMVRVRFLWIDALCIIQAHSEDKYLDDWETEATRVGSYYRNALFTISALTATTSGQGIFFDRSGFDLKSASSCVMGFDSCTGQYLHLPTPRPTLSAAINSSALIRRGWCFQEDHLSPRVLYWSRLGVFWQCYGDYSKSADIYPYDLLKLNPSRPPEVASSLFLDHKLDRNEQLRGVIFHLKDTDVNLGILWAHLCDEYSSRDFTFESDRLIAIQGIADRLADQYGDRYCHGIFESHIARGLSWCSATPNSMMGSKEPNLPSWSWASSCNKSGARFYTPSSGVSLVVPHPEGPVQDWYDPNLERRPMICFQGPVLTVPHGGGFRINSYSGRTLLDRCEFEARFKGMPLKLQLFYEDTQILHPLDKTQLTLFVLERTQDASWNCIILQPFQDMYRRLGWAVVSRVDTASESKLFDDEIWTSERKEVKLV